MQTNKTTSIILAIIALTLIAVIVVLLFYKNKTAPIVPAEDQTGATIVETIPSTNLQSISTENWKTYTNAGCGYSFQYPNSWSQWGDESNAVGRNNEILSRMVDFMDTVSQGIERSDGNNNQIAAAKNHMHVECYTRGTENYNYELADYNNSRGIFAQDKKIITVAGQTAIVGKIKNTSTVTQGDHPGRTVIPTHYVYVYFLHKDQTRALYFEFDTPLGGNDAAEIANFEQLLKTFKFTDD